MRRTQLLLHAHQHAALTAWAAREGVSLSALVRRLLERELARGGRDSGRAWLESISGIAEGGELRESDQDRALYEEETASE